MASFVNVKNKIKLLKEYVFWGGKLREKILTYLLCRHYQSSNYRDWYLKKEQPHFYNLKAGVFVALYGKKTKNIGGLYSGFNSSEVIKKGDICLDIGCGDGFFSKCFFSDNSSSIDAIDIEKNAIKYAKENNANSKLNYMLRDAVTGPFPRKDYDVIIWEGAIGHFAKETTHIMLKKIQDSLKVTGIFTGSESLGMEGHDHLQFFSSLDELHLLFKPYFKFIALKSLQYNIDGDFLRTEAYWRCSNDLKSIENSSWKIYSSN